MVRRKAADSEVSYAGKPDIAWPRGYATHRFYSVLYIYYLVILALDAIGGTMLNSLLHI